MQLLSLPNFHSLLPQASKGDKRRGGKGKGNDDGKGEKGEEKATKPRKKKDDDAPKGASSASVQFSKVRGEERGEIKRG